ALGLTQLLERGVYEQTTGLFGNNGTAGKDGDVFQHGLATIAEARSLDSSGLEDATDVVDNQSGQGFAFNVFSDDEQRTAGFCNLLQNRQQIANVADLLVVDQDIGIFQNGNLLVLVVDEVGRQVAAVELHAFDDVQLVFERFAVFNGDHAFLANFVHGVGNDLADGLVAVGRDGANLSDFLAGGAGTRDFLQLFDSNGNSLVDTALQVHGVDAGGNVLQTFFDDGLGQYGSGSGTVTSVVGGFGSNFLDQLRTDVLELVFQFDFFGDRNTVLGDRGSTERTLEHNVTAFGAQCGLDGIGQGVYAANNARARVVAELYLLSSHCDSLLD